MATTYNHIRMSEVDSSGNVRVMYPETTGADVTISRSSNSNIPSTVSTAQGLADKLVASAFTNPISDSTTTTSSTWSSNKINTAVTNINLVVNSSGKLAFTNSAGTTTELNFSSASGTATAAQVLTGYTFSNSSGKGLNGSMANQGAWTSPSPAGTGNTCNASTTKDITIPAGYHNGSGYVRIASLSSQTSGTAAAGDIISGKTAWVNGSKLTGTYTAASITSITPSNASPVSLAANTNYKPSAAGYAISSYSSVTPANGTIPSLSSGSIYKMGGAGYAIASYTSVTPTNGDASTAVPSLTSGSIYKMGGAGKAVASVTDIEPSNQTPVSVTGYSVYRPTKAGKVVYSITDTAGSVSGTSYSQNTILRTTATVYVYSAKPTHTGTYTIPSDWKIGGTEVFSHSLNLCTGTLDSTDGTDHTYKYIEFPSRPTLTETMLWENNNPTSSSGFAAQTVNLSQSMRLFKYLQIEHYAWNTNTSIVGYNIYPVDYIINTGSGSGTSSTPKLKGVIGGASRYTAGLYSRQFYRASDTSIYIEDSYQLGPGASGTSSNKVSAIPARIVGLK